MTGGLYFYMTSVEDSVHRPQRRLSLPPDSPGRYTCPMGAQIHERPTLLQSTLVSLFLISLSILLAPFSAVLTVILLIRCHLNGTVLHLRRPYSSTSKTVLITGARSTKCLVLLRAFKCAGHRVILAEENAWGSCASSRFSSSVDKYYSLPDPTHNKHAYIDTLCRIVAAETVDAWVPCSSAGATVEDAEAAMAIRSSASFGAGRKRCDVLIQHPELAASLHWKDQFMALCDALELPTPNSCRITSVQQGIDFLYSPETIDMGHRYILKCLALDDVGRADLTLLPLESREATLRHLSNLPLPVSDKYQYVLQRFVRGPEYCSHAAIRDGRLIAFVVCQSSDMLMRYVDAASSVEVRGDPVASLDERKVAQQAEDWTKEFIKRWKERLAREGKDENTFPLTGHFSFDFILEESEQKLYPIECNPRVHTAITLLSDCEDLASYYLGTRTGTARPAINTAPRSWLVHSLPLSFANLLPAHLRHLILPLIHPRLSRSLSAYEDITSSPQPGQGPFSLLYHFLAGLERDPVFDVSDPVPFFVLAHVQWPYFLARQIVKRRGWSRVNVSTSRIFEC